MIKSIFQFLDYLAYMRATLADPKRGGRGQQGQIARAIGSPSSHVSQVLSGRSHLTLEQAASLNAHWRLGTEEGRYFLLLVSYARAGHPDLKRQLRAQIDEIRAQHAKLRPQVASQTVDSGSVAPAYYSHWSYAATHMLLTIPRYRTASDVAKALGLDEMQVARVVAFLVQSGLAEAETSGGFRATNVGLHLAEESPWLLAHHANWRQKAVESLMRYDSSRELRYSGVVTLAEKDIPFVRERLVEALRSSLEIIGPSSSERLMALNIDWFGLV